MFHKIGGIEVKALIIDDEIIIRTGIAQIIPWSELGFTLLPLCESAEDAIPLIEQEQPDLILTDIRMNGMDGLSLAAIIRAKSPLSETIVYTGHDNFFYAQQALREGVSDYLLKTSRPDDIIRAALKAKERIIRKHVQAADKAKLDMVIRERTMQQWLNGKLRVEEVEEALPQLMKHHESSTSLSGLTAPQRPIAYTAAEVHVDGWRQDQDQLLLFAVENLITEMLACSVFRADSKLIVVQFEHTGRLHKEWEQVVKYIEHQLKCRLAIGVGSRVTSYMKVHQSVNEACRAYRFQLLIPNRSVVRFDEVMNRAGLPVCMTADSEQFLIQSIKSCEHEVLKRWLSEHIDAVLVGDEATPESIMTYVHSMLVMTYKWLENMMSGGFKYGEGRYAIRLSAIASDFMGGREQLERSLFIALQEVMQIYRNALERSSHSVVSRAMLYIREHPDGSLTLQHVANEVHVSANHLSERFKVESGLNYIEFVTHVRMERACRLLQESQAKVADISQMVGYEDVKYFTQLFKKHIGCTPSEYRDKAVNIPTSSWNMSLTSRLGDFL